MGMDLRMGLNLDKGLMNIVLGLRVGLKVVWNYRLAFINMTEYILKNSEYSHISSHYLLLKLKFV